MDSLPVYIKDTSGPGPFGTRSENVGSLCEASRVPEKGRMCRHGQNMFVYRSVLHRKKGIQLKWIFALLKKNKHKKKKNTFK